MSVETKSSVISHTITALITVIVTMLIGILSLGATKVGRAEVQDMIDVRFDKFEQTWKTHIEKDSIRWDILFNQLQIEKKP